MSEVEQFVRERLDGPYVRATAEAVAEALRDGAAIEVAYQPGDGTRYDLVFVPVHDASGLRVAPPRVAPAGLDRETLVEWEARAALGVSRHVGAAVVAWVDHGVAGLDLSTGGFVGEYVAEIYRTTLGSGCALVLLFEQIAWALR